MATKINEIVNVTITKETKSVAQAGFGIPLILGPNGPGSAYDVNDYNSLTEVGVDYSTSDDEYKAAAALFAQSPRPEKVKIAKQSTWSGEVGTLDYLADFVSGNLIDVLINDVPITQVPWNTSQPQTMTDLAAAIQAHPAVATAAVTGPRQVTITGINGLTLSVSTVVTGGISQTTGAFTSTTPANGPVADLNQIILTDDTWYALLITSRDKFIVLEVAAWIETQLKIFGSVSADANIHDGASVTDLAYLLNAANYDRTFVAFNEDVNDWFDAAWFGRCLPTDPGSITWMFMTLAGPTVSNLNATQRNDALDKKANLYTEIGGRDITERGTMASGEYIDITRGIDWLTSRMQENIFQALANADKIPYSESGIAIIEGKIRMTLDQGIKQGLLTPDPDSYEGEPYSVTVPRIHEIAENDRANRLLPDVEWEARLAGAIHKVIIQGRVVV